MSRQPSPPRPLAPAAPLGLSLHLPLSRRQALRLSLFSTAGLLVSPRHLFGAAPPAPAAASAAAGPAVRKAKSIIQIFLWGGMSHNDTWDPKPDAGYDYNGPMKTFLPTNVPGITLSEWFPRLAKQADKFALIRSMTHRLQRDRVP